MTCFFTSSPNIGRAPVLNPENGFVEELRRALPGHMTALFICSDPDAPDFTDPFAASIRESFEAADFDFDAFAVLDRRTRSRPPGW